MTTALREAANLGQSMWLDTISRGLLKSGGLDEWIGKGVRGVTTNPSIFEQAIAKSSDYDSEIEGMAGAGAGAEKIYESLTMGEVGAAADAFRRVYDESGTDGFVSLEVNPLLASDAVSTLSEAKRLFAALSRPNVMIKIPATHEGVQAIEDCTAEGINVNATLIFSVAQYESAASAYVRGLTRRSEAGLPVKGVASVASVFVSRIDTAVDKLLSAMPQQGEAKPLIGHIAVDNAKAAYERFKSIFSPARAEWRALAEKGAAVQRPLWASTGTKNAAYSDVLYVESLIGRDTVNTVPPGTLTAFIDHGRVSPALESGAEESLARLAKLAELGVDLDSVCASLLKDGTAAFVSAFESLMASIAAKAKG
ncbi:MAG: transaldolase [Synergistaceae bacterium]|jgi:transaldolase|nr:transaldolase [Synergistaceae bacterium]